MEELKLGALLRRQAYGMNCLTAELTRDTEIAELKRIIQNFPLKIPLQLRLHILSRHKERPPSDLSLCVVFYVLLIHRWGSRCTFEVENILLCASTKMNLCVSICQVHVLQSLRSGRGLCVTLNRKTQNSRINQRFQVSFHKT